MNSAARASDVATPRVARSTIVGIGLASALVPLNSTMIAVGLRSVAEDFDISKSDARVLITVYLAAMLVGQPFAGRIADRFGAKRTAIVALCGFGVGSAAAALAPTFDTLVGARTLQAVFAAALSPSVQSMLRSVTAPGERGRAFGILGAVIGAGVVVGPLLGGQLVDSFEWHAIFWVNLPLVVVCLVILGRVHVASAPARQHPGSATAGRPTWTPVFSASFATQALTNFAQYGLLLMCPLILEAQDWDAKSIGRVLTAMTAGMILVGPIGGRYGDRVGRRLPVMAGLVLATIAVLLLIPAGADVAVPVLVLALALFGVGLGFSTPGLSAAAIEAVPEERTGLAAGWLSMSRYVGSIVSTWLISLLVDDDGTGTRTMVLFTAVCLVAALCTASVVVRVRSGASPAGQPPSGLG